MLIDLHTHHSGSADLSIFNAFDKRTELICSYGIHPWYAEQFSFDFLEELEYLVQQPNCLAIGECGLDKLALSDWNKQMQWLEIQISLSEKYRKPLIVHCVKAIQELILLRRKINPSQVWIFHGFRKTNTIQQLLEEGFYLSIGTALLTDEKLQKAMKDFPLERLFLETDDKEMNIRLLYEKLAVIRKIPVEHIKKQLMDNFEKVFDRKLLP